MVGLVLVLLGGLGCAETTPSAASPSSGSSGKSSPTTSDDPGPRTEEYATIDIFCSPPTPVLVDGKPAGTTPVSAYKVQPGKHEVTFADEETGARTMEVEVGAGEGTSVTSNRPIRARDMPSAETAKPSASAKKK